MDGSTLMELRMAMTKVVAPAQDIVEPSQPHQRIVENFKSESVDTPAQMAASCQDISTAIGEMNSKLNGSINDLSTTLTSAIHQLNDQSTLEKLLFAMFVVFIGALSAYIFNHLHWRYVQNKQNTSSMGKSLIELIDKLEILSVKYWVQEYCTDDSEDHCISEIEIKTLLRQIGKYTTAFNKSMKCRDSSKKAEMLTDFVSEAYDLITGDGFESATRAPSKPKATKIARECSDARVVILSAII